MLIGINSLLQGQLLAHLDEMGHGDKLVIADANFPAQRLGSQVVNLSGINVSDAISAIVTVFPVDRDEPLLVMAGPDGDLPIHQELVEATGCASAVVVEKLDRRSFYDHAQRATLIVLTGELRSYGNIILSKGVVAIGENN
ncbi:MAG: L-fucose mutarotase [Actinomycetales bacterium]|nr:L-fucose mutarotase [Actinomycetales bacterium]